MKANRITVIVTVIHLPVLFLFIKIGDLTVFKIAALRTIFILIIIINALQIHNCSEDYFGHFIHIDDLSLRFYPGASL